jgi:hypothetical protein
MVRGLALAETTPGPSIMVVQFVAFLGAYHQPGNLNPWLAGLLASLLVVWVTFVPSFVFASPASPSADQCGVDPGGGVVALGLLTVRLAGDRKAERAQVLGRGPVGALLVVAHQ